MINVLITGMGSTTAISALKGLRLQSEFDVRIIGIDINNGNQIAGASLCDKFYKVPNALDDLYITTLVDICKSENIQIVFPIIDIELGIIASSIEKFENIGVYVWLSESKTIGICNDKYNTFKFFIENDFPAPASWLPAEIENIKDHIPYPLIIKPRDGVSSRDIYKVYSHKELLSAIKKVNKPLLQKLLIGKEYTIDVLCNSNSHALVAVPRERIETKAGISYKGITIKDKQLIDYGKSIAEKLHIKGACNIQCIIDSGTPKFFEVNPRLSGSLPLTIEAGINIPLLLIKMAQKEEVLGENLKFKEGIYMTRYWKEVFYHEN